MAAKSQFQLVLIKPSHYDDDGYVIQWLYSLIPSNTLAALYGLAQDCIDRQVLGEDVEIKISAHDECNTRINVKKIVRQLSQPGTTGLVGFVGVQSNQFPHTMDLARQFRQHGIPVCIGGFHVSGTLAMLPETPPELNEAMDLGISLFAGEAEGRLEQVLKDAHQGSLKPLYNFMDDLPGIEGTPIPYLPKETVGRQATLETTFDAGRGCPFLCSFCTIINVQGRKSRRRSVDDIEKIIRRNFEQGIRHYFITDDNFARNQNWEPTLDRLIHLRENVGIDLKMVIQVDTMCHKLPNFVAKAARAGVNKVFIGLESINPDALSGARKKQNRITEYRTMLQNWHAHGIVTYAGYILGFPTDTPESVKRDIEIIKNELPIDVLEFFNLTPLPGSEDHQKLHQAGAWMEPDLNKYNLCYVTTDHPLMSREQWEELYRSAWDTYYTPEHMRTLLRRARATGIPLMRMTRMTRDFYAAHSIEGLHPLEGGLIRRKHRRDRRPGLPLENPFWFYPRFVLETIAKLARYGMAVWRHRQWRREIANEAGGENYQDIALTPVVDDEVDRYELFNNEAAQETIQRARKRQRREADSNLSATA